MSDPAYGRRDPVYDPGDPPDERDQKLLELRADAEEALDPMVDFIYGASRGSARMPKQVSRVGRYITDDGNEFFIVETTGIGPVLSEELFSALIKKGWAVNVQPKRDFGVPYSWAKAQVSEPGGCEACGCSNTADCGGPSYLHGLDVGPCLHMDEEGEILC